MPERARTTLVRALSAAVRRSSRTGTATATASLPLPSGRCRTPPWSRCGYCGSGPVATGRLSSWDHSDQEPTYSAAGMPATASARTSCAPETPEPQ